MKEIDWLAEAYNYPGRPRPALRKDKYEFTNKEELQIIANEWKLQLLGIRLD